MAKNEDFGKFLSKLANEEDTPTNHTLKSLQAELAAERQEQIKRKLRSVFDQIQSAVGRLRSIRMREQEELRTIKSLEKEANDIVKG